MKEKTKKSTENGKKCGIIYITRGYIARKERRKYVKFIYRMLPIFTISAKGTLTLHVTDTGDPVSGVQIIGAKFIRTDSAGTITGVEAITDHDGNAVFNNVPFAPTDSTEIYYKQITSDGGHTFDDSVKSIIMTTSTQTVEIANPAAPLRNIMLTDASFPNIPIKDGQITLEDNQ